MATDSNIINLPDDIHTQLDNKLHILLSLDFKEEAAMILSTVINGCARAYATTKWPIDPTFVNMMECEDFLASNQEIRNDLEKAHRSGQYEEIRNRRQWQLHQHSPSLY
jgi:hypothetical protein